MTHSSPAPLPAPCLLAARSARLWHAAAGNTRKCKCKATLDVFANTLRRTPQHEGAQCRLFRRACSTICAELGVVLLGATRASRATGLASSGSAFAGDRLAAGRGGGGRGAACVSRRAAPAAPAPARGGQA